MKLTAPFSKSSNPVLDMKLPPRAAFTAQILGTLFGGVLNFGSFFSYLYLIEKI